MEYRHEILRLSEEENLTERQIALRLHLSRSTVHYWLERRGHKSTTKSGRPRVTNTALDNSLYEASVENPFLSAVDLQRSLASHCSVDTVRNRLKEKGLKCRIPARKPFLSPLHRQLRHAFAVNRIEWQKQEWDRIVFSDEKIFRASSRGALRVYRPKRGSDRYDDQYLVPSTNPAGTGRFTICVWLAFGGPDATIRTIHRIEQATLNADYYTTRILPSIEDVIHEQGLVFMQDLSSIHTSRLATQWLQEHNWRVMVDWPPKGPDMNPVENIWAELVRRIEERRRENGVACRNRDQLWEDVRVAFEELEDGYFENLIASMPKRVATVSRKHGGWTKY